MPSIGHIAVGLAAGRAFAPGDKPSWRPMLAFSLISLWPDADAVAFLVGIPYWDEFGHRGATHSLLAALLVGLASYLIAGRLKLPQGRTLVFTTLVAASHCLLDTLTYGGGYGCALLWPSPERYWSPVRLIPISPIGLRLLSHTGLRVMLTELLIFGPLWLYAFWPRRTVRR